LLVSVPATFKLYVPVVVLVAVPTVMVELVPTVIVVGLKVALTPAGKVEVLSVTVPL
jgi:hypothetical protein